MARMQDGTRCSAFFAARQGNGGRTSSKDATAELMFSRKETKGEYRLGERERRAAPAVYSVFLAVKCLIRIPAIE